MGKSEPTAFLLNVPLYISIFLWVLLAVAVVMLVKRSDKKWPIIVLTVLLGIFSIASAVLLFFQPVKNSKYYVTLKCALIVLVIVVAVFGGYGVTLGSRFTYEPVVYAVEDTYQIVFSTNHKATAWVEIEGEEYYELYAGSMKSNDTVHKITVPQGSCWYGCVCGHS